MARPRASWSWGPGNSVLVRPSPPKISRRQSPGRFRGLSRSISPRRNLVTDYHYRGLIQEALLIKTNTPFPGDTVSESQQSFLPSLNASDSWPRMECPIPTSEAVHEVLPIDLGFIYSQEPEYEEAPEGSDDSVLDDIEQLDEQASRLDPNHPFWRAKNSLFQRAQVLFAHSYLSIQAQAQKRRYKPSFSCPYFYNDPKRHWDCLADTPMGGIRDVKRHLGRCHSQPFYCPVCYDIFPLESARDAHITRRACEKRDVRRFDGMSPEQKNMILAKCKGGSGPDQWRRIWSTLFGRPPAVLAPFLPPALAWDIMLVTDFWRARGAEITEQCLGDMGLIDEGVACQGDDESAVAGLARVVLRDLVGLAFWRSGLVRSLGNIPTQAQDLVV